MLFNGCATMGAGFFVAFNNRCLETRQKGCGCNACPHDATTDHADFIDWVWCSTIKFRKFGNGSFGKKNMTQCLGLIAIAQFDKLFAFMNKARCGVLFDADANGLGGDDGGNLSAGFFTDTRNDFIPLMIIRCINWRAATQFQGARAVDDGAGEILCGIAKGAMRDGINQADCIGLVGRNRFAARNHGNSVGDWNKAWQAHCATSTGNKSQINFWQAELRTTFRNPVMTAKGDFQPTPQRMAMNGGNDWFGGGLQPFDHIGQNRVFGRLAKFTDIGTGNERFARTD